MFLLAVHWQDLTAAMLPVESSQVNSIVGTCCVHAREYRTTCMYKLLCKMEKTGIRTYEVIRTAFQEEVMSHTQVFERFQHFKDGCMSAESDQHSGHL